jgi:PTH1 family peptidyl-tRNA hydrolase
VLQANLKIHCTCLAPALTHSSLRVKLTRYKLLGQAASTYTNPATDILSRYLSKTALINIMVKTFLVVGLGNPGREYRETRHNIGFMLLNQLAAKLKVRFMRMQSRALVATATYNSPKIGPYTNKIILAKPQTLMNLSGQSVQGLLHFYKLPLSNLLVAHDDLDLPLGTIRIRPDGGSAGQKGMKSILEHLGTDEFARLRLGIGHPPGQMQAHDYVLQDFSRADLIFVQETLSHSVEAVLTFVTEGLDAAMNKYNGIVS